MSNYKVGIYKITNLVNGKFYIGSSLNIKNRWNTHIKKLNNGNHENQYLLNAFNKYGVENFKFERIENVKDKSRLLEREQFYLDSLNPFGDNGYNICRIAGSHLGMKRSEETKKKMSEAYTLTDERRKFIETQFKKYSFNKGHKPWNKGNVFPQVKGSKNGNSKSIFQYDYDTCALIKKWDCADDIFKEFGYSLSIIRNNCNLKCNSIGEIIAFKNFIWSYMQIDDLNAYKIKYNIIKKYKYLGIKGK